MFALGRAVTGFSAGDLRLPVPDWRWRCFFRVLRLVEPMRYNVANVRRGMGLRPGSGDAPIIGFLGMHVSKWVRITARDCRTSCIDMPTTADVMAAAWTASEAWTKYFSSVCFLLLATTSAPVADPGAGLKRAPGAARPGRPLRLRRRHPWPACAGPGTPCCPHRAGAGPRAARGQCWPSVCAGPFRVGCGRPR